MPFDTGVVTRTVAGISLTAAIAATSMFDRPVRRIKMDDSKRAEEKSKPVPESIPRSASQDTPYVIGNVILSTNMLHLQSQQQYVKSDTTPTFPILARLILISFS